MTEATDSSIIIMLLLILGPIVIVVALILGIFLTGKTNKSKDADEIE